MRGRLKQSICTNRGFTVQGWTWPDLHTSAQICTTRGFTQLESAQTTLPDSEGFCAKLLSVTRKNKIILGCSKTFSDHSHSEEPSGSHPLLFQTQDVWSLVTEGLSLPRLHQSVQKCYHLSPLIELQRQPLHARKPYSKIWEESCTMPAERSSSMRDDSLREDHTTEKKPRWDQTMRKQGQTKPEKTKEN